jgi:hypothetical protein
VSFLRRRSLEIGFIAALLVVYIFFSAPGLTWGDGAFFALVMEGGARPIEHYGGHPVYLSAAKAFAAVVPAGDLARRFNLFSSVTAAGAAALFLTVLVQLGLGRGAAICGTALLAFSHLFWFHAEVSEVYAMFACFFFGSIALLLRYLSSRSERNLQVLLFVLGLGCGCHPLIILAYPGVAAAVWRNRPAERLGAKGIIRCVLAFIIGLAPVIYVFIIGAAAAGVKQGFLNAFFLGHGPFAAKVFSLEFITNPYLLGRNLLLFIAAWIYQFAGLAVVLVVMGIPRLWRMHREPAIFALITAVINFVFAIRFSVSDHLVFFTPVFLLSALAGAFGAGRVIGWFRRERRAVVVLAALLVLAPAACYYVAPFLYHGLGLRLASFHGKPYHDPVKYFLVPVKRNYRQVERYVQKVFYELPEGAAVLLDSPDYLFLKYYQHVRGEREDVQTLHFYIAGPLRDAEIEGLARMLLARPTHVGEAYAEVLGQYFELEKAGITSRVKGRLRER